MDEIRLIPTEDLGYALCVVLASVYQLVSSEDRSRDAIHKELSRMVLKVNEMGDHPLGVDRRELLRVYIARCAELLVNEEKSL